jgi:hypothetical protein
MENMQFSELNDENRRLQQKINLLQSENKRLVSLFKEGQSVLKNQAQDKKLEAEESILLHKSINDKLQRLLGIKVKTQDASPSARTFKELLLLIN